MNNNVIIKHTFFGLLMLVTMASSAQERLFDLMGNQRLSYYDDYIRSASASSRAAGDTLDLPFFDDFSEPFSRLRNLGDDYPNPALWQGNTVYVNNHMAINPISQGVATFDGLDERGRAYAFGTSLPTLSDSLTSNCIRLANAPDTVYLSFYYQAQGMGNAPEDDDVLVLEFKDTAETWNQVWDANGYILEDFDFRRAMVRVWDEKYLFDGFQFRFTNYASRSGNVDHWHIDYVELDGARSKEDTLIEDVSYLGQTNRSDSLLIFFNQTNSLLKEFSAMPWIHYRETSETTEYMRDSVNIALRNNYNSNKQVQFIYRIRNEAGVIVHSYESPTGVPVTANRVCGSELDDCEDDPNNNFRTDLNDYHFAQNDPADSVFFAVEYVINGVNDAVPENDVSVFKQEFYNYYAYDDGTAEAGYGLGELENVGRVAVKYNIKKLDTLQAIQLYLNPVEFDLSQEPVQLVVWGGNEEPDDVKWISDPLFLNYTNHINNFYHYLLDDTVLQVVDNIWIGWIQQPATNLKFSVGFDMRTDNSDKVFYNLGTTWSQSSIPGSVMIRPVFGQPYTWVEDVGVGEEPTANEVLVYPNPSTGTVHLQEKYAGQLTNASVQVFDLSGRMVFTQSGNVKTLQLERLIAGTYILRVESEKGVFTQRLILQ